MNYKCIQNGSKLLLSFIFIALLSACGNSDDTNATTDTSSATSEMPDEISKLTLTSGGTLQAFVTVDGGTKTEMTINTSGAGSASISMPGLSLATHTIVITYEYTDSNGTIVLASATNTIDLSSGSGSLSFLAADYDINSFDEDGDGISNAAEVAAGTDPNDSVCILGSSTLDNCTMG